MIRASSSLSHAALSFWYSDWIVSLLRFILLCIARTRYRWGRSATPNCSRSFWDFQWDTHLHSHVTRGIKNKFRADSSKNKGTAPLPHPSISSEARTSLLLSHRTPRRSTLYTRTYCCVDLSISCQICRTDQSAVTSQKWTADICKNFILLYRTNTRWNYFH